MPEGTAWIDTGWTISTVTSGTVTWYPPTTITYSMVSTYTLLGTSTWGWNTVETPGPVAPARRGPSRERAEALLLSLLTDEQRATYHDQGWVEGVTSKGNPYRIFCRRGISGNVEVLIRGEWLILCAHPDGVPDEDVFLAQKLVLETDEEHFMRTANVHGARAAA